jgi:8-oxo-dGTP diphosphatase
VPRVGEPGTLVRAAGGVVVRDGRVAVVHRPKYDDWSLPKGKLEPGESWEAAALREVQEETGLACRLQDELPPVEYEDRHGRSKTVRYWRMAPAGDAAFRASGEVDELRWLPPVEAVELLSYLRDRRLVALALLPPGERGGPLVFAPMQHRNERVYLETSRHRISGLLTLARDGYRSRVSDLLNASERDFISLTDCIVEVIGHEGPGTRHDFIAVSRRHIVFAIPESGDGPPR